MKVPQLLFIVVLLWCKSFYAQTIFYYEKEIPGKENYEFRDIDFKVRARKQKDSITISGTLICPKEQWDTVIIIVPGTGADTRNSHYLLTERLLQNNIAVYRYDERGIGRSGGKFNTANNTIGDMSEELMECIAKLRKGGLVKKIGLFGHSLGGMVTIEACKKGAEVDFLIQCGTPIQKHGEFIKYQLLSGQNNFNELIRVGDTSRKLEIIDALHKVVEENTDLDDWELTKKLDKVSKKIGYTRKYYARFPYLTLASEKDIVRKNFEPTYKGIAIPVLYIVGTQDTFIDPEAETAALASLGNANISIVKMEGLTHYLTPGRLKLETMYEIDNGAFSVILEWLNKLK